jgi:hypothetical protein
MANRAERPAARREHQHIRRGYHDSAAWIPSLLCVESITPGVDTINDTSKDTSIPGAWIRRVPYGQISWGPWLEEKMERAVRRDGPVPATGDSFSLFSDAAKCARVAEVVS